MVLFCVSILLVCINQCTGLCFMAEAREGLNTDLRTQKPNLPFGDRSPSGLSRGGWRKHCHLVWAPQPCLLDGAAGFWSTSCLHSLPLPPGACVAGHSPLFLESEMRVFPSEMLLRHQGRDSSRKGWRVRAPVEPSGTCQSARQWWGFRQGLTRQGEERFRKAEKKRRLQNRSKCWGDKAIAAESDTQAAGRR